MANTTAPAEIEAVLRMTADGAAISQISKETGVHRETVRKLVERAGISVDWQARARDGRRVVIDDEQRAIIRQRWAEAPTRVIAAQIGLNELIVAREAELMKLGAKPKLKYQTHFRSKRGRGANLHSQAGRPHSVQYPIDRCATVAGRAVDHLKRYFTPAYHRIVHDKVFAGEYQVGTHVMAEPQMIELARKKGFAA